VTAIDPIVLAGGRSARFGDADKALATVGGTPMLVRAVRTVAAATGRRPIVAVATAEGQRAYADALDDAGVDAAFVRDDPALAGPVAGIASAVSETSAEWLLICACDLPLVTEDVIDWLGDDRMDDVDAVVPAVDGKLQPLCGVYRRTALRRAVDAVAAGERNSVRALLDRLDVHRPDAAAAPEGVRAADALANVNTREQLRRARDRVE